MKITSLKKLLSVLLAVFMLVAALPAVAAEEEFVDGTIYVSIDSVKIVDGSVTISGRYSDNGEGSVVTAMLTASKNVPSYTSGDRILAAELKAENPATNPAWRRIEYTITLNVPDWVSTGKYWIHVGSTMTDESKSVSISYLGYDERETLLSAYNADDATAESLKSAIDRLTMPLTIDTIGADGTAYGKLSTAGKLRFAKLLLELGKAYKAENKLQELGISDLMEISSEALLLAAIDSSAADEEGYDNALNLFKAYAEDLLKLDSKSDASYNKVFNADNLVKAIKAQHPDEFSTVSEVREIIDNALTLAVLNETSHLAYLNYIEKNNDFFQIDEDELQKASRNTKVAGYYGERIRAELPVYSFEEFAKAWERASKKAEKDYTDSQKNSGSSGGSGGGSGSSGSRGSGGSGTVSKSVIYNPGLIGPDLVGNDPLGKNLTIYDYYDDIYGYEWAFGAIVDLTEDGVISGTGNKKFEPGRTLKREEFMKLLVNAFDLADMRATSSFTDVDEDAWYYMYIASAEQAGITAGRGDGTFGIGDDVTREEMATLVYRAAQKVGLRLTTTGGNVNLPLYSDLDTLSPYALEAVSMLAVNGIMAGETGNLYAPKKGASRAQAALVIYNAKNFK